MADRFFYWRGASGQKYIHSVYDPQCCPPLPGAVYVAVKRAGHLRIAMAVGRFSQFWDKALPDQEMAGLERLGVDEIHVHLLARNPEMIETTLADLKCALGKDSASVGFNEPASSWTLAA